MLKSVCRHRGEAVSPGVHRCGSPKLLGLKLVTERMCGDCHYWNHEPVIPSPQHPAHLLTCLRRGREVTPGTACSLDKPNGHGESQSAYECLHHAHPLTTDRQCRGCPDYLYPIVTPETPPATVAQMLELPPHPQPDGWWRWANAQEGVRRAADAAVADAPPYPGGYDGQGVVIVGGGNYFASAYVTVRVLRHVGCQLPIQLWHLTGEVTEAMRAILRPYDVTCIDADEVVRRRPFRFLNGHWWKGWQLKPYAAAYSSFREVLLLDADSYPIRNPEFLFTWPSYREHGAIFWPDLPNCTMTPENWAVFGLEPGCATLESGQFLVNKEACWRELQLALWYNGHAEFVYNILWGDKDTFNIAWKRLGTVYSIPRRLPDWETHTILQYGPDDRVLFQHRCQDKFRLGPNRFASTYQQSATNKYNPRLALEDLCFQFLDELRRSD
jgi:hypothetical protein